jgi:integrase
MVILLKFFLKLGMLHLKKETPMRNLEKGLKQLKKTYSKNKLSLSTVNSLMKKHLIDCTHSRVYYRKKYFVNFMLTFGQKKIYEITKRELIQWYEQIKREQRIRTKTVKIIRGYFNHFFNYLVEEEILPFNPQADIKFKVTELPRRFRTVLSPEELKQILSKLKDQRRRYLYHIVYILLSTGARRGEILNLTWRDINFALGTMTFRKTKNGDDRTIKLSQKLLSYLKKIYQEKSSKYVIVNEAGRRFQKLHFYKILKQFKRRNPEQKDWTYHDLRHSFAHNFLKNGGNMYALQAILGHKSISMTIDLYGQLKAADVKNPSPYDF